MSVPASTAAATAPTPDVPTPVSDRPLSDRLADKTLDVKARRLAYSELVGLLRDASIDDPASGGSAGGVLSHPASTGPRESKRLNKAMRGRFMAQPDMI